MDLLAVFRNRIIKHMNNFPIICLIVERFHDNIKKIFHGEIMHIDRDKEKEDVRC